MHIEYLVLMEMLHLLLLGVFILVVELLSLAVLVATAPTV